MLSFPDNKIVLVVLDALNNIFELGKAEMASTHGINLCVRQAEACRGSEEIERTQKNPNAEISKKASDMLGKYFNVEEVDMAPDFLRLLSVMECSISAALLQVPPRVAFRSVRRSRVVESKILGIFFITLE